MKRKVIQIAESTQLISLPRKWAVQYGVKKGDELEVEVAGNQIMVSPAGAQRVERIDINVSDLHPFVLRAIDATYKSGYDEVDVHFTDSASIRGLSAVITQEMPEFEIIEQTATSLRIRSVSTASAAEFESMLRRLFLITLSIAKNVADMATAQDFRKVEDVLALEKTNNRLCNFCERLLNKYGFAQYRKPTFLYCMIWEMEKIADQYKYLCMQLMREKQVKLRKESVVLIQKTHTLINTFYELFYKFNPDHVATIAAMRKDIIEEINERLRGSAPDFKVLHHTMNITQMVFNLVGCYFGTRY